MIGRENEVREYRSRLWIFQTACVIGFVILLLRLFFLQVVKGTELRVFSEANRLKKEKLIASRGILYDRNGKVIVDNRAAFDVVLLAQYYPFSEENNARLAKALQMDRAELDKKLQKAAKSPTYYPILLKADVKKDVIAAVETDALGFPGVDIEVNVQRRYPYSELAAQLLGYISEVEKNDIEQNRALQMGDYIGRTGVERIYDADLRGEDGIGYVEVDAMGRRRKAEGTDKVLGFVNQTDPMAGNNLYLTLDVDLLVAANESMKRHKFSGTVIALNPQSGEVLSLINSPSYDPGLISGREVSSQIWHELQNNKDKPLRSRAIQDIYMPGSTFKAIMAVAALSEGTANANTSFYCPGHMVFGNRRVHCWKAGGHGQTNIVKAIRESCNVFFYNMGNQMGVDIIAKYARMFGFGERTGIVARGEQRGLIPDTEWKKKALKDDWHPGETLSVAVGQGYVSVTPIQLVNAYATIGNGGFLYKPYMVRRIESPTGNLLKEFRPELKNKVELKPGVLEAVKEGLFEVANQMGGTAFYSGRSKKTVISGKTGTAQVRGFADMSKVTCANLPYHDRHHGWFVAYAPRENPEIAVVALAEHGCHGASASPIVRDVIEAYIDKQNQEKGLVVETPASEQPTRQTPLSSQELDE